MISQGFFFLRRPLLSRDILLGFLNASGSDQTKFESYLTLLFSDARLQQAIHLASPQMHALTLRLVNGELKNGKSNVLQTLFKYLIRMSTRSTPFGLFAGYSLGFTGKHTRIAFSRENSLTLVNRLDGVVHANILNELLKDQALSPLIKYYPNPSLYELMGTYRYVERISEPKDGFQLSAVQHQRHLEHVLNFAKEGVPASFLTIFLTRRKMPKSVAHNFIQSLIDAQILSSGYEMSATGTAALDRLKNEMLINKTYDKQLTLIYKIDKILREDINVVTIYDELKQLLDTSGIKTAQSKHLIQTDLRFNTQACEIGTSPIRIISDEIKELLPMAEKIQDPDLTKFAAKLFERYGSQPVSLLQALDETTGIGYGPSVLIGANGLGLLDGLESNRSMITETKPDSAFSLFQRKALQKALQQGSKQIELTESDIAFLSTGEPNHLPDHFYLLGSLIADSQKELDNGNFQFDLQTMAGPSGLNLMTRFGPGDQLLKSVLSKASLCEQQQQPEMIYAEICHVPNARSLNVLSRPTLLHYEIPYLSNSSVPSPNQIMPGELMISSIDGQQLVLSCPRLNKRIIPQLTTAHNFSTGLPVYRFLGSLARQSGGSYVHWDWPQTIIKPFFPRVTFKHLILQKATWQISSEKLTSIKEDNGSLLKAWDLVCQQLYIPRYVQIQQGDNMLLIDGQSLFSVQLLASHLKKHTQLTLIEYMPGSATGFLTDSGAGIDHEVILPFLAKDCLHQAGEAVFSASEIRQYDLGSEWLYLKVYCSTQSSDYLLTTLIEPFLNRKLSKRIIDRWFYVRYYDPAHQLRIRIRMDVNQNDWSRLLKQMQSLLRPYLKNGLVSGIKTDTYVREIERYKLLPYTNLETLFFADSVCISACLKFLIESEDVHRHWLLALRSCDLLLDSLQLDLGEKFQVTADLYEQFSKEIDPAKKGALTLDRKYRSFKNRIFQFLDPSFDKANEIEGFMQYFQRRSTVISEQMPNAYPHTRKELLELCCNLLHLSLNRWFSSEQRKQEWAIYHFLKKYYDTKRNIEEKAKIK